MNPARRYQPGQPIDTREALEVRALDRQAWEPIQTAYPEIATAGPNAAFRYAPVVTIYPPCYVPPTLFRTILDSGDRTHFVYPHPAEGTPKAVLVHIVGGYASLHIYRLIPARKR